MQDSKPCVTWNEANLVEIEDNKPLRQKITEPKTPYHPSTDDAEPQSPRRGSELMLSKDLRTELDAVDSSGSTSCDDRGDPEYDEKDKVARFREQRRAHYNEFHKVKELLNSSGIDDESEEGSDENDRESRCATGALLCAGVEEIDFEKGLQTQPN